MWRFGNLLVLANPLAPIEVHHGPVILFFSPYRLL
jgi:hypothetical protein